MRSRTRVSRSKKRSMPAASLKAGVTTESSGAPVSTAAGTPAPAVGSACAGPAAAFIVMRGAGHRGRRCPAQSEEIVIGGTDARIALHETQAWSAPRYVPTALLTLIDHEIVGGAMVCKPPTNAAAGRSPG